MGIQERVEVHRRQGCKAGVGLEVPIGRMVEVGTDAS